MAKPKTKEEILEQSAANFEKLMDLLESLSKSQLDRAFSKGTLNRNIPDVLMHLHAWHKLFFAWHQVGMKGGIPSMPAEGYSWQTLPKLNLEIWKENKGTDLKEAKKHFKRTHKKMLKITQSHTGEELFAKKLYPWTGSTSLAAYLISNSVSHYNWAYKLIKRCTKEFSVLNHKNK